VPQRNSEKNRVADKTSDKGPRTTGKDGGTVIVKKYANRRLYNTATSTYVTLEDLATMVREGVEFLVYDAKSNEDLTRQILTQIIFEEESRGEALLPVQFLRQLIGFYGGQMQGVLPSYLEMSLDNFSRQQEQLRGQFSKAFGATPGAGLIDEAVKRNMAMFEQAMKMFPGFAYGRPDATAQPTEAPKTADPMAEMRRQMDEMRDQLDKLSKGR
jgi:polyhydroxyalkanoate synthesis repressor PhaR